jgi:aromatic ring-opening dioxygenase LigB subunit
LEAGERPIPPLAAFGVPASMRVEQAVATGRTLAGAARAGRHVGLLVMGDLSARRTPKAPETFHPAAEEFDRQIAGAIGKAELGRLLDADAGLAAELRVGGMAALWLLAGALEDTGGPRTEVLYEAAPFGVGYLVGVIETR